MEHRNLHLVACTLAIALAAPTLSAQRDDKEFLTNVFKRYDRDANENITRREFPGSDAQFVAMDADKNNKVDFEEFEKSPSARRLLVTRRRDASAPRPRDDSSALILRRLESITAFDRNRDGKVLEREWTGSPTAFEELDLDKNGVLDKNDRRLAKRDVTVAGVEPKAPEVNSPLPSPEELLRRCDKNKDQQIQRREAKGELPELFDYADRDNDGALDLTELRRLVGGVNAVLYARNMGTSKPRAFRVPFSTWDKNKDGRLEAGEFVERRYLFPRIDQNRDAAVTPDEVERYARAVENTDFVSRFDLNDDGKVTLVEFGGSPNAFRRADKNGDGAVSRADR